MIDNEKLIEDAAKAINLRYYRTDTRNFDAYAWDRLYREMATDALAVFEKAHTPTGYSHIAACCTPVEPQGEPSDAQVEAALDAWDSAGGPDAGRSGFRVMRAALRAAGNVR